MAERMLLNDNEAENVVGGAFIYTTHTNPDGTEYMTCLVEDTGITYFCKESAKRNISLFIIKERPSTVDEVVQYALDNNYFWE